MLLGFSILMTTASAVVTFFVAVATAFVASAAAVTAASAFMTVASTAASACVHILSVETFCEFFLSCLAY